MSTLKSADKGLSPKDRARRSSGKVPESSTLHLRISSAPQRRAFTLVELLVSVAIIGLLISVLLPSLTKAREQAKLVACLANIKGIATANITYSLEDPREQTIPIHHLFIRWYEDSGAFGAYWEYGGKSGIGESPSQHDPLSSIWGTRQGRGPGTRPLNDVLYKRGLTDYQNNRGPESRNWIGDTQMDLAVFRCPSDRGHTGGHHFEAWKDSGLSSYDHYGTSYGANALWWRSNKGDGRVSLISPLLRARSRVPNPANTVYYLENCGLFAWAKNGTDTCHELDYQYPPALNLPNLGWHRRPWEFSTAFIDGHAAMVKMEGHFMPAPFVSIPWLRRARKEWDCGVMRGPSWQMDTLPGAPVSLLESYRGNSPYPSSFSRGG